MTPDRDLIAGEAPRSELEATREVLEHNWEWFIGLGALLVFLGLAAVGASAFVTLATVVFFGILLILAGIGHIGYSMSTRRSKNLSSILGFVYLVAGILIVADPSGGAVGLTLLFALFLLAIGVLRILFAVTLRDNRRWGGVLLTGILDLVLAALILAGWPSSSAWILGLFVGIELVLAGWGAVVLGLAARKAASSSPPSGS
jgi:uncharacterized membrane protein HdeD (DUF308 family)